MNRIHPLAEQAVQGAAFAATAQHALLSSACRRDLHHALFAPLHYEPNYGYPLIVWLHGPHGDERQLQRVMPLVSMRNYVAVAPRGTERCAHQTDAFYWDQSLDGILDAEQRVFDCMDLAQERFHVDRGRVFLAGFQCGGTMAFRVALNSPARFAGVLSVGGPFPADHTPLIHLHQARRLPLFIAQGRTSRLYPIHRTCQELRLFHAAGLAVTLRQYPCGDELSTQMLHDMNVWMMEQITGVEMRSEAQPQTRPGETN